MQITCPLCGERDIREFSIKGDETYLHRPEPEAGRRRGTTTSTTATTRRASAGAVAPRPAAAARGLS
jgi:sarcosine oxidase delta subunit